MEVVCLIQTSPGDQGFTYVSVYLDIPETNARPTLMSVRLIRVFEDVALMELTTTLAYVILDTLDATVPLTMTIVVLLLVFMGNVSTTLEHTDARAIPDTVDGTALLTLTNASHHLAIMEYALIMSITIHVSVKAATLVTTVTLRSTSVSSLLAFAVNVWMELTTSLAFAQLVSLE